MEESRKTLLPLFAGAAIAVLAGLTASFGEMWSLQKARNRVLEEELSLAQASGRGLENELASERIVSRHELESLRVGGVESESVALLLAVREPKSGPCAGAVAWAEGRPQVRVAVCGLPPGDSWRLFLVGANGQAEACGSALAAAPSGDLVSLARPVGAGDHFEVRADATGSICLASQPLYGKK